MSSRPLIALALCSLCVTAQAEPAPRETYDALVAAAERGEAIDYTALRHAYTYGAPRRPHIITYVETRQLWDAFAANDCKTVLALAEARLKLDYLDYGAHQFRVQCLAKTHDDAGFRRAYAISNGLSNSIMASGDGGSFRKAYKIVSPEEENFVIGQGGDFGFPIRIEKNGHVYEQNVHADIHGGRGTKLLFNIDAILEREKANP